MATYAPNQLHAVPLAELLMPGVRRTSLTAEINKPCRKAAGVEGKNPSRLDLNNG